MLAPDVFRAQPVLPGVGVRLEPLTEAVLESYLEGLGEPELARLTGSHGTIERAAIEHWLRTRAEHHDRADWAVLRAADGAFLGEAVLNELDTDNGSVNYRVWLAGPEAYGHGYGTEVTRLVLAYALDVVGVHRVSLGVYAFNGRARRAYEKCGFVEEGRLRDALHWHGAWHDEVVMAVLATDPRPRG